MPGIITNDVLSLGDFSYNGVDFPPAIRAQMAGRPIYDDAGVTVIYVEHTLIIETVLVYDSIPGPANPVSTETDNVFNYIRSRLTQPGQPLRFTGQGFGTVSINEQGGPRDLNHGPKPEILNWEPMGGNSACVLGFAVKFHMPACLNVHSAIDETRLRAFNFTTNWSVGANGMQVRRISGHLQVPVRRTPNFVGTRAFDIFGTADAQREFIREYFPIVDRFERTYPNISLSEDKSTLSFDIVDTEIPSDRPFFPGTVNADVSYEISSGLDDGFFSVWTCTIGGTIESAPNQSKFVAFAAFASLVTERLELAQNAVINPAEQENSPGEPEDDGPGWIPVSMRFRENLFNRSITFSFTYTLFCSLEHIFAGTGILLSEGNPNLTWQDWSRDRTAYQQPRGYTYVESDDPAVRTPEPVIDVCVPTGLSGGGEGVITIDQRRVIGDTLLQQAEITEANSYIYYDVDPYVEGEERNYSYPVLTNPVPSITSPGGTAAYAASDTLSNASNEVFGTGGRRVVILRGHIVRIGYKPEIPELLEYAGQKVVKIETVFVKHRRTSAVSTIDGKDRTIYHLRFKIRYVIVNEGAANPEKPYVIDPSAPKNAQVEIHAASNAPKTPL